MAELDVELNERFAPPNTALPADVMGELQSISRLHSISPQELFYKWESYSLKMGTEQASINLKSARDFKKDLQEVLEREVRGKTHSNKKSAAATPRSVTSKTGGDLFGLMDGVDGSPNTPRIPMRGVNGNSAKRRNNFETPVSKASKLHAHSSPGDHSTPVLGQTVIFAQRQNAGQIVESLNAHIEIPNPPSTPFTDARVKLKANTDLTKFSYKSMAMKLSGSSEILDDRIDGFQELVQRHYNLDDGAFGNPANQSTNEIMTIGRIASDTNEGRLNAASLVLETSRRTGAGVRVPLKLDSIPGYDVFPGKIVALRGTNASGDYFAVSAMLDLPLLPPAASTVEEADNVRLRIQGSIEDSANLHPLNIMVSSGPYTADSNLEFEPLHALCDQAIASQADALVLLGPFLDVEHPLIKSGNFPELPASLNISQDDATLTDVFRGLISLPLQRLTQSIPNIQIILVPSVRDAVHKHVCWPQDKMNRKELGLPRQVASVTNPITISLNEMVVGISSEDVLQELHHEKCAGGSLLQENLLARLSKQLIGQRHFFPLFPSTTRDQLPKPTATEGQDDKAVGAMLDISYLALGEWQHVRPDVLITPSALAPFAKVVESVLVINPGTLSKKKGPGTFARLTVEALHVSDEEREANVMLAHKIFDRTRVDIVRI